MIGVALIVVSLCTTRNMEIELLPKATMRQWLNVGRHSKRHFVNACDKPAIILGGIYGGIFTHTDAAAASAVYGLLVGFFIYKTLKLKDLYEIFVNSTTTTSVVMFITATI